MFYKNTNHSTMQAAVKKVSTTPVRHSTAMHLKNMGYYISLPWNNYTYLMLYFKYCNAFWKAFFSPSPPHRLTIKLKKILIVFIHQHSMKKALKKLWANARWLTTGLTLHSIEQLLDFFHSVQIKKGQQTPKPNNFPEHLLPVGKKYQIKTKLSAAVDCCIM